MTTIKKTTLAATSLLLVGAATTAHLRHARAVVMPPTSIELILDELAVDDHSDPFTTGSCDVLKPYSTALDTFYRGRGTTLTQYLGNRYPGILANQTMFLNEDGFDLNDPATMLTYMVEGQLSLYKDWQANDTALRAANLILDVWMRNNTACVFAYSSLRDEVLGAAIPETKDYDGDWKADIAIYRGTTGEWLVKQSGNMQVVTTVLGTGTDLPVPGDYDGDRRTDYGVWRPSTGDWTITLSSTGARVVTNWGAASAGDIPVPNDYDGDGKTDLAVWRQPTAQWFHIRSSDNARIGPFFGQSGDRPVVGDFDGDGKADLTVWRPATGEWITRSTATGQTTTRVLGAQGDRTVAADYDGDKKTDMAVFRASTGTWTIALSTMYDPVTKTLGAAGDIPVAADFDGDGRADIGVWRPSNATWYYQQTYDNVTITFGFGLTTTNDVPVPSVYYR